MVDMFNQCARAAFINQLGVTLSPVDIVAKILEGEELNGVPSPENRWQLNMLQCQHLASFLHEAKAFYIQTFCDDFPSEKILVDENLRKVFEHLHITLKRAEILVESCCCDESTWLQAAVSHGEIRQEVTDILYELQTWGCALTITICRNCRGEFNITELEILRTTEERMKNILQGGSDWDGAAARDRMSLLNRLENEHNKCARQDHEHDTKCYLVAYLQSQLRPAAGVADSLDADFSQKLIEFKTTRFIGRGGFASVYEVTWLNYKCALKVGRVGAMEVRGLSRFQHPNIVRFYRDWVASHDSESDHGVQSHILMEYIPNDLQKLVDAQVKGNLSSPSSSSAIRSTMPFPLHVAIDIMLQMTKAMCQLHDNKMTHRDLKPGNILVAKVSDNLPDFHHGYLHVKLADFGLCKWHDSSWALETANTGTTKYAAPELFSQTERKIQTYPKAADVWSFGVTASVILTGEVPYRDEPNVGLQKRILSNPQLRPTLPNECPDYLRFCLTSCCEVDPKDRPTFHDLLRMLRYAKLISLGILKLETCSSVFCYTTREKQVKRLLRKVICRDSPPIYKKIHRRFAKMWSRPRNSIADSPRSVVDQLVEQLNSIQIDIWQVALKKLHTLTEDVRNHVHIAEAGVIPLLPLLVRQYTSMEIQELVMSCLENIVIHNKDLLATSPKDCFEPLFQSLKSGNQRVQEKVAAILALLPGLYEYAEAICKRATIPTLWILAQSGSPKGKVNAMFAISRIVINEDRLRHKIEACDGAHPLQSERIPNVHVVPPVAKLVNNGMSGAQGSVGIRTKCLSKVYDILIVWEDAQANHWEDTKMLEEHLISVLEIGTKLGEQFAVETLAGLVVHKALPESTDDIITAAASQVIKRFSDAIIQKQTILDVVEMFKVGDLDERVMAVKVLWDISCFEAAEVVANTLDNPQQIARIIDKVKMGTLQEKLKCVTILQIIATGARILEYLQ